MPGQPAVPQSAPAAAPAAACGPGHRDRDRRSLARSQSKPDSSEYLQRVKFQSKSRDNTTASLRGKNLNLPKLKLPGRTVQPGSAGPAARAGPAAKLEVLCSRASNLKSLAVSSGNNDWASIAAYRHGDRLAPSGPARTDQPACTVQNLNNQAQGMAVLHNYFCSPRQTLHQCILSLLFFPNLDMIINLNV